MHEVVVYSKPDCCLCDEVKSLLRKLAVSHPFVWREVNILEDPEIYERFKVEIPVVFIDGKKAFKYHIDEKDFLRRLSRPDVPGEKIPTRSE
jgi:glutaredoxin